ncbi:hypothetical protein [Salmonella phage SD-1_S14]|nr:hypothetical protein [Salmonella phage SD-1_S14]
MDCFRSYLPLTHHQERFVNEHIRALLNGIRNKL